MKDSEEEESGVEEGGVEESEVDMGEVEDSEVEWSDHFEDYEQKENISHIFRGSGQPSGTVIRPFQPQ